MVCGVPRECISTYGTPLCPTSSIISGLTAVPETSLTMCAPASIAASAVSGWNVSTLTTTPRLLSSRMTGSTRRRSSAGSTPCA